MKKSRVRIAASAAVLAAAAFGATGCGAINQQATTLHYDASDGVSAGDRANLVVNNLMLVTNGSDDPARFIGRLANDSAEKQEFSIDFDGQTVSTTVDAKSDADLHEDSFAKDFTVKGVSDGEFKTTDPGLNVQVTVTTGDTETELKVPVVDGTLEEYAEYVPGGSNADVRKHMEPATDSDS
ncbi:MAG: hypothetical protein ACTMIK_11725, partial [Galactobacter sp.]